MTAFVEILPAIHVPSRGKHATDAVNIVSIICPKSRLLAQGSTSEQPMIRERFLISMVGRASIPSLGKIRLRQGGDRWSHRRWSASKRRGERLEGLLSELAARFRRHRDLRYRRPTHHPLNLATHQPASGAPGAGLLVLGAFLARSLDLLWTLNS